MRRALRWILRGIVLALAAGAVLLLLGWYLVSRSLPDYDAGLTLAGLDAEVVIVRDQNAVPHIRAETEEDAFFTLGLVHAQDRLWQMEVNRRAATGQLAALLGAEALPLDRMVKTFDLEGRARDAYAYQTPATRRALDAYAAGVNAWIETVNTEARGRGAPEFFLFGAEIAPWTPTDSLAILKLMALRLTASAESEVRRARFLLELSPERVQDILPDHPNPAITEPDRFAGAAPRPAGAAPLPDYAALMAPEAGRAGWVPRDARSHPRPAFGALAPAADPRMAGASNAWAVDGSRTATGAPLLANDPHLWLSAPSLWYLADIEGGDIAAIGGTLPGTPIVLIGRNEVVGWGLTTAQVDDQDIYIEKLDPDDPGRYRTPDGWATFDTRPIKIAVAGGETVEDVVLETRHGPVLTHDIYGVNAVTPQGHVAALAWTALEREDRTMSAIMRLMSAGNLDDAVAAAELALAPAQVVTIADGDDVGMVTAGAIPLRQAESRSQGRVPSPGWIAENDWTGFMDPAETPRTLRPEEGAVANANNRLTDDPFPEHLTFDWGDPYRITRLVRELSAREFHSRDGFVALQNDAVSQMARSVLPQIALDLWWRSGEAAGESRLRREALEKLANWTGNMDRHSPEPLIFAEWMRMLTLRLAQDELGPLIAQVAGAQPVFVERVFRDIDGAGVWCDIVKTREVESCSEIAALALDDALARLAALYGENMEGWRWGAAHVAEHAHTPLSRVGPLDLVFSIRQETSGGDFTLLRGLSPGRGPRPFQNVHAAGMRVVYDFADLDRSVWILSTGQSGHPLSRFYDNLSDDWARGDVIPMSRDEEDIRTGAVGVTTLTPAMP
ncbi:MAG TPA: penicillin acylase family protein [Thermohalobaculum sp.]|nr:penicillin acylase family protein [Thermohalobaculum sp.]